MEPAIPQTSDVWAVRARDSGRVSGQGRGGTGGARPATLGGRRDPCTRSAPGRFLSLSNFVSAEVRTQAGRARAVAEAYACADHHLHAVPARPPTRRRPNQPSQQPTPLLAFPLLLLVHPPRYFRGGACPAPDLTRILPLPNSPRLGNRSSNECPVHSAALSDFRPASESRPHEHA